MTVIARSHPGSVEALTCSLALALTRRLKVYHLFDENGVMAEPLLPRLDDALVAEIRGKDIISLERYTGTFAGVHIGYDRPGALSRILATTRIT